MDRIEPDALYDQRADVSRARPLLQGDVFDAQKDTGLAILASAVTLTLTAIFGRRTPTPSRD